MAIDFDLAAIKRRGGFLCGNDDFAIVRCTFCRCQYLYNEEVLQLYLDPNDLSRRALYDQCEDMPPCRDCGLRDWDIEESPQDDLTGVADGPWAWALIVSSRE